MSGGYAVASQASISRRGLNAIKPARKIEKTKMKLTLRQRIGNWLLGNNEEKYANLTIDSPDSINSNGMRFNLYKARGGFVIETRVYDERTDRNTNQLYVITDDKDLGAELGKIITMESLR